MSEITANLVVQFTNGAGNSVLTAQIDSREDSRNGGSTTFIPGQEAYYLITKTDDVTITEQITSTGRVEFIEEDLEVVDEMLTFANSSTASVSQPISGSYATKWLGNIPNATLVKSGASSFSLLDASGTAVKATAVLKIQYTVLHQVWKLTGVPTSLSGETVFEVVIVVIGQS